MKGLEMAISRARLDFDGFEDALRILRLKVPSDWGVHRLEYYHNPARWFISIGSPWVPVGGGSYRAWSFNGEGTTPAEAVRNVELKW